MRIYPIMLPALFLIIFIAVGCKSISKNDSMLALERLPPNLQSYWERWLSRIEYVHFEQARISTVLFIMCYRSKIAYYLDARPTEIDDIPRISIGPTKMTNREALKRIAEITHLQIGFSDDGTRIEFKVAETEQGGFGVESVHSTNGMSSNRTNE